MLDKTRMKTVTFRDTEYELFPTPIQKYMFVSALQTHIGLTLVSNILSVMIHLSQDMTLTSSSLLSLSLPRQKKR